MGALKHLPYCGDLPFLVGRMLLIICLLPSIVKGNDIRHGCLQCVPDSYRMRKAWLSAGNRG
ncbi:hypothetical protein D3OALGA1CA_5304 [Olavius algarvensis associated proteobacterium Delta 3]|nr:hypothetical protein D3OALGA1CA_5304 [Olavius algarvensis associated proteobacterium Delta 3]